MRKHEKASQEFLDLKNQLERSCVLELAAPDRNSKVRRENVAHSVFSYVLLVFCTPREQKIDTADKAEAIIATTFSRTALNGKTPG